MTNKLYKTLNKALHIARPHGSTTTERYTKWLRGQLPAHLNADPTRVWRDALGNLHVDNRDSVSHRSLFIAHVDTVHRIEGSNRVRKTDGKWFADGAALGADDGVGNALLMHMLDANVPGYYIFSQGEECGGLGAKHIAELYPDLLVQFDRAIAFDRKGVDSVISHQGYSRCCSDVFAQELADALNATDDSMELMYSPDDTGVYTDTAEFTDIIPECTNISCGYMYEHTQKEELDMGHFDRLAAAVLLVAWDDLPVHRDPTVPEYKEYARSTSYYDGKWDSWKDKWYLDYDKHDGLDADVVEYDYSKLDELGANELDMYLYECLKDAKAGHPNGLIEMMAESVYPEDPGMARKFIDDERMTDAVLDEALEMVGICDVSVVLSTVFDAAYVD